MKTIVGITIDAEVKAFLKEEAKKQNRSFSNLINVILRVKISNIKKERKKK